MHPPSPPRPRAESVPGRGRQRPHGEPALARLRPQNTPNKDTRGRRNRCQRSCRNSGIDRRRTARNAHRLRHAKPALEGAGAPQRTHKGPPKHVRCKQHMLTSDLEAGARRGSHPGRATDEPAPRQEALPDRNVSGLRRKGCARGARDTRATGARARARARVLRALRGLEPCGASAAQDNATSRWAATEGGLRSVPPGAAATLSGAGTLPSLAD